MNAPPSAPLRPTPLVVALGMITLWGAAAAQANCPVTGIHLTLGPGYEQGRITCTASHSITTQGDYHLQPGAAVALHSVRVTLKPGFHAQPGSTLRITSQPLPEANADHLRPYRLAFSSAFSVHNSALPPLQVAGKRWAVGSEFSLHNRGTLPTGGATSTSGRIWAAEFSAHNSALTGEMRIATVYALPLSLHNSGGAVARSLARMAGWEVEGPEGKGGDDPLAEIFALYEGPGVTRIAIDRLGRLHIAWADLEQGHLVYGLRDADGDWSQPPTPVVTGAAEDLTLAVDSNGLAHLAWVDAEGLQLTTLPTSEEHDYPTTTHLEEAPLYTPRLVIDSADRLHLVWLDPLGNLRYDRLAQGEERQRQTLPGQPLKDDNLQLAVDREDQLHLLWNEVEGIHYLRLNGNDGTPQGTGERLAHSRDSDTAALAISSDQRPHLLFSRHAELYLAQLDDQPLQSAIPLPLGLYSSGPLQLVALADGALRLFLVAPAASDSQASAIWSQQLTPGQPPGPLELLLESAVTIDRLHALHGAGTHHLQWREADPPHALNHYLLHQPESTLMNEENSDVE